MGRHQISEKLWHEKLDKEAEGQIGRENLEDLKKKAGGKFQGPRTLRISGTQNISTEVDRRERNRIGKQNHGTQRNVEFNEKQERHICHAAA